MKTLTLCFTFLFFSILIFGNEPKWGKVSKEEINYKECVFEKEASAVILYEKGVLTFENGISRLDVYKRIKILDPEAFYLANQAIKFYSDKGYDRILNFKGQTININQNGEVEKHKIEKNKTTVESINDYWSIFKFIFPTIQKGSIIEYKYSLYSERISFIDIWDFQHEIPTLYSEVKLNVPEYYQYKILMKGEDLVKKYSKNKDNRKLSLINIESKNKLEFVYNRDASINKCILQLVRYQTGSTRGGGGNVKEHLSTWEKLYDKHKLNKKIFISKSKIKELATQFTLNKISEESIRTFLLEFSNRFKWNRYYATSTSDRLPKVIASETGNVAELNTILSEVLKAKGVTSSLVLISTRNHGKVFLKSPFIGQFNNLITKFEIEGRSYLINAAMIDENQPLYLNLSDCNIYGLELKPKPEWIYLQQNISNKISSNTYTLNENNKINVISNNINTGYFWDDENILPLDLNLDERILDSDIEIKNNKKYIKKKYKDITLNQSFFQVNNPLQEIINTYKFTKENREDLVELDFPFYIKGKTIIKEFKQQNINIPDAFNFETSGIDNNIFYAQKAEIIKGNLIIQYTFLLRKAYFYAKEYKDLKIIFDQIIEKSNQSILIKL